MPWATVTKKPLGLNKSKEGRAQNRRVDIIITPAAFQAERWHNEYVADDHATDESTVHMFFISAD